MTSRDFCYWLQGFLELDGELGETGQKLTEKQTMMVRQHLAMVFVHEIDPSFPKEQKAALDKAHAGKPSQQIGGSGPGGTLYRC